MTVPSATIERAETIAIGTELLLGEIHDTNGAWLASALAGRGVDVYWSLRVGDNPERVQQALRSALARSDLVVTCGGLGPTEDDVTREAIAALVGETPAVDASLERDLRDRFARLGRPMAERNLKQAWSIPSAVPLDNPRGTAPGWLVRTEVDGAPRWIAALPGPPHELIRMAEEELFPALPLPASRFWSLTLKTAGIGESHVADRLGDLAQGANPSVATYARADGVHVRVAAKAEDAEAAEELARPVVQEVERRLGEAVWGRDGDALEAVVADALGRRGIRLAIVEEATDGALAARLAAVPSARERLMGAVIPWSTDAKDTLGVPHVAHEGADPGVWAERAAASTRRFFAADAAIAVGALRPLEVGGGSETELAVTGTTGDHRLTVRLPEAGGTYARDRIVLVALDLLRRRLRSA